MSENPEKKQEPQSSPEAKNAEKTDQSSPSGEEGVEEKKESLDIEAIKKLAEGKKILVADDDPTTTELVSGILSKVGFEVIMAKDGHEAWNKLTPEANPILIISDVIMPEMDGYKFFKELKKNDESKEIPIIILSARKNMEDTFLALGAESFLHKPIDAEKLLQQVVALSGRGIKVAEDRTNAASAPKEDAPKEE